MSRRLDLLLPAALGLFLVLPGLLTLLARPEPASGPTRAAVAPSPISPAGLEAAFNDAWAPRQTLIAWNGALRLGLLGESPLKNVVKGQGRWLYYAGEWNLEDYERVMPLSEADLGRLGETLEARRRWLAARGVRFLVVVCPNKEAIYPEYLPTRFHPLGDRSRLDQVADWLGRETGVDCLDLRPALLAAKGEGRVYHYTDTHWNDLGAWVGAQAIAERLRAWFPAVRVRGLEEYAVEVRDEPGWDLAKQLLLAESVREDAVTLTPRRPLAARPAGRDQPDPVDWPGRATIYRSVADPRLPKALIFRDSFSTALHPFLSEAFRESAWVWDHRFLTELVERERPDVVILQVVERYIPALAKPNPPEVQAALRN